MFYSYLHERVRGFGVLVGGELTDGSEDGEVKGSCVEEQGSNHPLDPGLLRGRDGWGDKGRG